MEALELYKEEQAKIDAHTFETRFTGKDVRTYTGIIFSDFFDQLLRKLFIFENLLFKPASPDFDHYQIFTKVLP